MDYDFCKRLDDVKAWARRALDAGWIAQSDLAHIDSVDDRRPSSLFASPGQRPLVVAFFGGTGVGKSSLLNRLAGQPIARVGVERPTSREITLYHHETVQISQLPVDFPVEKIRVERHNDQKKKGVVWIDMPDMDSTEQANRSIVIEWLPHIDVLIYVVSPERYRDDKGWRLLRSEGAEHAWIFVMNRWDEGQAAQLDHLDEQLTQAGFERPVILRTECQAGSLQSSVDDFEELERIIVSLANAHTIKQLEILGMQQRLAELRRAIALCVERFGDDHAVNALRSQWAALWQETAHNLVKGLVWPMQQIASTFVSRDTRLLPSATKNDPTQLPVPGRGEASSSLWDDWAQTRFDDALDRFIIEADANGFPPAPFKNGFEPIRDKAGPMLESQANQSLRAALANPGNALQRFFLRCAGISATLMPLAAIGWVAWQVFNGYYTSSINGRPYLGSNFAIHSTLLITIAWLLPWFTYRKLRPSTEKVALKGVQAGVTLGIDHIEERVAVSIGETLGERQRMIEQAMELDAQCRLPERVNQVLEPELLSKLLPRPEPKADKENVPGA